MSLDLVGALKAPWRKDCGVSRLFLGGLCIMVPFLAFVPMGYVAEYLNKMFNGNDELGNIFKQGSKSFVVGGKLFLGYLLLCLPNILLYLIFSFMLDPFLLYGVASIFALFFSTLCLLMLLSFGTDFKILSYIDFERLGKIVKENPTKVFIVCLLAFVINIAYSILMIVPYVACFVLAGIFNAIGLTPISLLFGLLGVAVIFLFIFAIMISIANILGQFGKESKYIQSIKQDLA